MAEPTSKNNYEGTSRSAYQRGRGTGATEQGYTNMMKKNILGAEASIRMNKDESMHVFDSKGRKLVSIGGKGASVSYAGHTIPRDSIITHNHPRSLGQKGVWSFGNSFSQNDIVSAISLNAREIRAVTPTYTFSVKRPKGGWGDVNKIARDFNAMSRAEDKRRLTYVRSSTSRAQAQTRWDRDASTHYHRVMKKMASKYGWDYTKKKG